MHAHDGTTIEHAPEANIHLLSHYVSVAVRASCANRVTRNVILCAETQKRVPLHGLHVSCAFRSSRIVKSTFRPAT
jgi:hypothetical protein